MTKPTAIDLFAGAGGATLGLAKAGFRVLGAVEIDPSAAATHAKNHPDSQLWESDIRSLRATSMRRELGLAPGELTLLKTCPPCQGFSSLASGRGLTDQERNDLVIHTVRFVRAFLPRAVLLENVPGLSKDARLAFVRDSLHSLGYATQVYEFQASRFGVPQRRRRLIMLAVKGKRSALPLDIAELISEFESAVSVRDTFTELRSFARSDDPLDRYRKSSDKVRLRIEAIPEGGGRFDLPEEYQLECHKRLNKRTATASYGRIKWDGPAPTMTTRCTTPACGSFLHPEEHRGITLREAASLQTFPFDYDFEGSYGDIERQIGNAVPVRMATVLGHAVKRLVF
ncbi:DNA cytosine methyltransferase [Streptomyces sp. 130]|uniref:DNA cytosine methyltransferase n=1 Tax=Streptomyces sp. 130 TaxID=2591006 RepID=UPI00118156D1|nr:DNA cytosine methyltransferase [Streptomyces sp. 130]TRV80462.1 DNA cytosine methyltransferase [Streptomyces sp. 130]